MAPLPDFPEQLARLREGPGEGPRWAVPLPAALAGVVVTVVVVAVAAMLLLRPAPAGEVLPAPLLTPAAPVAAPVPSPMSSPGPSSAGPGARVYVVGQVREPGVVTLPAGARVEDAVEAAGGATGKADLAVINLARPVQDGEQIVVPKPGESLPAAAPSAAASPGASGAVGPVNLNTATAADLDALPGVGPVIAQRIVDWRTQNGGFTSVDDLGEVSGIGDATLSKLRPLVTV